MIELKINGTPISDFSPADLGLEGRRLLRKVLLELMYEPLQIESASIDELKNEIAFLRRELANQKFKAGIDQASLSFHEGKFAGAAADLLLNPKPILIPASRGKKEEFLVPLIDILTISSDGRNKKIFLMRPIPPKLGGVPVQRINVNRNDLNWGKLLRLLQGGGHHLMQANQSTVVNIHHYVFSKKGYFALASKAPVNFDSAFKKIKTDSFFDVELYHERLMEIDRLSRIQAEFAPNLKKIEEIARYKDSLLVTKSTK